MLRRPFSKNNSNDDFSTLRNAESSISTTTPTPPATIPNKKIEKAKEANHEDGQGAVAYSIGMLTTQLINAQMMPSPTLKPSAPTTPPVVYFSKLASPLVKPQSPGDIFKMDGFTPTSSPEKQTTAESNTVKTQSSAARQLFGT
ncbi:MAG TPA: hypothetical protein VLG38_02320 [Gammaproteobacteria bacterium]|nr:hypothetical protein [Gammaproteobacteria bacterium]